MSLLDDLHGLDVSGVVNARGSITSAVNAPGLQSMLSSGPASSVLGSLGSSLDVLKNSFGSPDALLKPVSDVVSGLGIHFDPSHLPIGDLGKAVGQGMQFVTQIMASVNGNPADFGKIFGTAIGDAVQVAGQSGGFLGNIFGQQAGSFNELQRMSSGSSQGVTELAELAIGVILPIPAAQLKAARSGISLVATGAARLQMPGDRASGLVAALDAVTVAAQSGDDAALQLAISNLSSVRTHMLGVLRDDLSFASRQLSQLRVGAILQPVAQFGATVRHGEEGVIEFLASLRNVLADVKEHIDHFDASAVREFMNSAMTTVEAKASEAIDKPVDDAVEKAKEFVRNIFRQIPIRQLRNELTGFLLGAAAAIQNAHLDGPANTVRSTLDSISNALDGGALTADIQKALQEVSQTIDKVIQPIVDALGAIATEVDQLASGAQAILGRVTTALEQFQQAINQISTAIDGLGIEQAEQQIVQALDNLRQQVQQLLSNVPLPEPLKPQVEQLTSLLEGIDFDQMLKPVRDAVAELKIPDDVSGTVTDGLAQAKKVIENLIPQQLIDSIQQEVDQVVQTLKGFNPASLVPDVSQYLNEAADHIEQLDPRPLAEQIRGPFQAVLDAIDKVNPYTLLQPVIDVYDKAFSAIPTPNSQSIVTTLTNTANLGGSQVTGALGASPAQGAAGGSGDSSGGGSSGGASGGGAAGGGAQPGSGSVPTPLSDIHLGDAIRLLGIIPAKLRDTLMALDAGPVGDVLHEIDSLCAGLARQIRALQAALYEAATRLETGFDAQLLPLGPASLRAHLAIQAKFAGHASLQVSLEAVTLASPGSMRRELKDALDAMRGLAHETAAQAGGGNGAALDRLATALESSPLAQLTANIEQFLDALNPEPIAQEFDALLDSMIALIPKLADELAADMEAVTNRMRAMINHYNPGSQAQKFLVVLDVLRDELNILNPRRLAGELAELHGVIRGVVAAYDPRAFADEIYKVITSLAQQIRALNPQQLLGNLDFLKPIVDKIEQANPATRLASVGQSLTELGERLGNIKLDDLISAVNQLGPKLEAAFEHMLEAVKQEIIALLESLRYATGSASASASVSIG
jgi:phage-related protein